MPSSRGFGANAFGAARLICIGVCTHPHAQQRTDVRERGYDRFRTGANTNETELTPTNVKSAANRFHRQFVMKGDGKIEGSPRYASGVSITGSTHYVAYAAAVCVTR